MSQATGSTQAQRLGQLFEAMRTVRPATLQARLHTFFVAAAGLRSGGIELAPALAPVSFSPVRLAGFFDELKAAVSLAKRKGAFLNVWEIAGLNRNEIRNAAVLAWCFDPRGSHGRGASILNAFLAGMKKSNPAKFPLPDMVEECVVATELCPLGDRSSRVDIVIDGLDFSVYIEVKIDAFEGAAQTARYVQIAAERAAATGRSMHAVIFLSTSNRGVLSAPENSVLRVTWNDVARAIEQVLRAGPNRPFPDDCLLQFADHIRSFKR